jgi:hypothetical protein
MAKAKVKAHVEEKASPPVPVVPVVPVVRKRDARDLKKLLMVHPSWASGLGDLDELERSIGVENPLPWSKPLSELLREAQNMPDREE